MTKFKKYLDSRGIKQDWIAKQTGWPQDRVSNLARGRVRMLASDMIALCDLLDCEASDIFDHEASECTN